MPRKKQVVQKQRRRKAYDPTAVADVTRVKPRGAFRIFTNYRIFAFIGVGALVAGLAISALFATTGTTGTDGSARGEGVIRTTPEAGSTAETGAQETIKRYPAPPEMVIDPDKKYFATIETAAGEIEVELLPQEAPQAVNNFVFLARDGFYDGVTFFRVVPGFVAQSGDPTGTGIGGPGYNLPFEPTDEPVEQGILAMAKQDRADAPNSGSQFFFALDRLPTQDGKATVFGRVTEGMSVLEQLGAHEPHDQEPGLRIESVSVVEP